MMISLKKTNLQIVSQQALSLCWIILNLIYMASQRKEELLKELDTALNRKVQQKYFKVAKTQQLNTHKETYYQERHNKEPNIDSKVYRCKDYDSRSPSNFQQNERQHIKTQRSTVQLSPTFANTSVIPQRGPSPRDERNRNSFASKINSKQQHFPQESKLIERVKLLQQENSQLLKELSSFKQVIASLEKQSKSLKRDETEYIKLKQHNDTLTKQIQFLKNKAKKGIIQCKSLKNSVLLQSLSFQESLRQVMMQLNISFINKQWNETFIIEAIQGINKEIFKILEEKSKLSAKLNKFDIQSVLAKQNNSSYKQQISILHLKIQNYEAELSACNTTIKELEQEVNSTLKEKKMIESKYKEACKEIQAIRRQIKIMESSKHSKPKRQASVLKNKESNMEGSSTVARIYYDTQAKTEHIQIGSLKIDSKVTSHQIEKYQETIKCLQDRVIDLNKQLTVNETQQRNLKDKLYSNEVNYEKLQIQLKASKQNSQGLQASLAQLRGKIQQQEEYIRQLQLKSQEINRDISVFMPQLKQIEQENADLKQANAKKDADIIGKHHIISELRNENELLQENYTKLQADSKNMSFSYEKSVRELQRLRQKVASLQGKNNELQYSMVQRQQDLHSTLNNQIKLLQDRLQSQESLFESKFLAKQKEIQQIQSDYLASQNLLQQQLEKNNSLAQETKILKEDFKTLTDKCTFLSSQIDSKGNIFVEEKQKLKQAVQQIMRLNHELAKKQTQYQSLYHSIENKIIGIQSKINQTGNSYIQLQNSLQQIQREMKVYREENQRLGDQNEEVSAENYRMKNQLRVLEQELANNEKGRILLERKSQEQEQKLKQLQIDCLTLKSQKSLLSNQNQKNKSKILQLQLSRQSQLHHIQHIQESQLLTLKEKIQTLLYQNSVLHSQCQTVRQQAENQVRSLTQQLSHQNYDIERLLREKRQLQTKIQQFSKLYQSKSYQENEYKQTINKLTEENQSLLTRNRYLIEQLQMKERNKQEDLYIHELKSKQYCLLVKKILASMIDLSQLQQCFDIEQLLEVGSQRVCQRKREIIEKENEAREINRDEAPRRFNFGVQVSSYEELVLLSSRHKEIDVVKQDESKAQRAGHLPNSPRSFILNLSPQSPLPERKEGRTQRLISEYHNPKQLKQKRNS